MIRTPLSPETAKAIAEEQEMRRKAREQRKAEQAAQCPQGPRSHHRWPYGIGAHAIAVCVLAALALLGYVLTH